MKAAGHCIQGSDPTSTELLYTIFCELRPESSAKAQLSNHSDPISNVCIATEEPRPSTTNAESQDSSLAQILQWPGTPKREGKRNCERTPFVITSDEWHTLASDKAQKRKMEEEAREERKRIRDERNNSEKSCDNAGEISPGSSTETYPTFARIGLRENPGKNHNQVTCPDRDLNPGHLVSRTDALSVTPQNGEVVNRSIPGRPRISTREEDPMLLREVENHPFRTASKLKMASNFPGSPHTVRHTVSSSCGERTFDDGVCHVPSSVCYSATGFLRRGLNQVEVEMKNQGLENLRLKVENICEKIEEQIAENNKLKKKMSDYDLKYRKDNLIIFGVEERGREKEMETFKKEATRRQQRVDVSYISGGKEEKKFIPTSRTEQVIVADQHPCSKEFRNPHADVRGSVEVMTQGEDKCNVIKQRKQIPSLHTMAVRLAHSRRNADNNGTRSTGVRKKASGDKKRNQESGSDREESSEKLKGASVSGNLGCESESVGWGNKRGIEEEERNRKKDRDRNKAEANSKERSEPATAEDIAMLLDTIKKCGDMIKKC
ncbi:hypothetical protein ANN_27259 [Periplaneta americana]|uniref:Uncharacterized protein n=1 Tax=Periplaneta americana TaxID=6978 RepID=A0ABQ8RXP3_PERAM|nr:hypothetical protein ANN_27259 [Periplaneta americana]